MGQKNIQGDVNFVGTIKQNDSPLSGGTKWYRHILKLGGSYLKNGTTPAGRGTQTISIYNTDPEPYTGDHLTNYYSKINSSIIGSANIGTNVNDDATTGTQAQAVCLYIAGRTNGAWRPTIYFATVITGQKTFNDLEFNHETITDRYSNLILQSDNVVEL